MPPVEPSLYVLFLSSTFLPVMPESSLVVHNEKVSF